MLKRLNLKDLGQTKPLGLTKKRTLTKLLPNHNFWLKRVLMAFIPCQLTILANYSYFGEWLKSTNFLMEAV